MIHYYISYKLQHVFRPPLEDYDVTIALHAKHNPRFYQAIDSTKALTHQTKSISDMVLPVVDFNPVHLYLNELRVSKVCRIRG